jgi:hypothetical protein
MPDRWAIATGNWSSTATWNNGAVLGIPTGSDDVYTSGSTVTIDQDINVLSLNTRPSGSIIAAGGGFSVTTSRNISAASIRAGATACLINGGTGVTINITGSATGSNTTVGAPGIFIGGVSTTVNISGSLVGGSFSTTNGLTISGTSNNLRIIGNVAGGTANSAYGIATNGAFAPNITITGSVVGGGIGGNNAWGIYYLNNISGSLNISGSVTGGPSTGATAILMQIGLGASISVVGDVSAGAGGVGITAGGMTSPYTINVTGNVAAGGMTISTNSTGLGRVNIIGTIAGSSGASGLALSTVNNLTINVNGTITGGSAARYGIDIGTNNFNAVIVTGSVSNWGITNSSNSPITVSGSAISAGGTPINNTSTGQVTVTSAVASTTTFAITNTGTTPVIYESATFATNGVIPISGLAKLRISNNNFFSCSLDTTGYKTLINVNNISNGLPASSDVRRNTTYNFGDGVGTMSVPSASYVDTGVAVDNTSGTGVYTTASLLSTVWDTNVATLTGSNSVGERLRNISTVSSTGDQLVALL